MFQSFLDFGVANERLETCGTVSVIFLSLSQKFTYLDAVEEVVLFCSVIQISGLQADPLPGYKKEM